jgi:hypothetical protein
VQKTFSVVVEPLVTVAVAEVGPVLEPKWQTRFELLGTVAVFV